MRLLTSALQMIKRHSNNMSFVLGAIIGSIISIILILSFFFDADVSSSEPYLRPFSISHPMGTDELGYDMFKLIIVGFRSYIVPGIWAISIALVIGSILGSISGYLGDVITQSSHGYRIKMVLSDIGKWMSNYTIRLIGPIPRLAFIFFVCATISQNIYWIAGILGIMNSVMVAEIIQNKITSLKKEQFIEAAQEVGLSHFRIIWRHLLLSYCRPVWLSQAIHTFADVILVETSIRFIWSAVGAEHSWGKLLVDAKGYIFRPQNIRSLGFNVHVWWVWVFPALTIVGTILGLHLFGDAITARIENRGLKD